VLAEIPSMLAEAERASVGLSQMARDGLRLDPATVEEIAQATGRQDRFRRIATWIGALSLAALAAKYVGLI
jgi:ubiquinone biosynthesis protein